MSQENPQLRPKAALITDPNGVDVANVVNGGLNVNVVSAGGQNVNIADWAGAVLSAAITDSPTGAETAPVVRTIGRKRSFIETTVPLGANQTYTGPWYDSQVDGTLYVSPSMFADKSTAASGFTIQGTDDQSNPNLIKTFFALGINANSLLDVNGTFVIPIRSRYWRFQIRNGSVAQTQMEVAATCYSDSMIPTTWQTFSNQPAVPTTVGGAAVALNESFTNMAQNWNSANAPGCTMPFKHGGAFSGTTNAALLGLRYCRLATIFRQASASATGNSTVWTPAINNKFRLLKFKIQVTANAALAAAGELTIGLQDNVTDIGLSHIVYVGTGFAGYDSGWIDLGEFGIVSAVANNKLNVNLSAALTAGHVNVIVAGVED